MTRNLKNLGLALVAVLALGAMAASSASAVDDVFTVEGGGSASITTEKDVINVFTVTSPDVGVKCTTANFTGSVANGASSVTVNPTYEGTFEVTPHTTHCSSDIGAATVDMNGCGYILTGSTTGSDNGTDATVWIECPAGQEIKVTTELVTLNIHEQTPTSGGVTYTNVAGPPSKVTVKATATGITYSCTPHFFCTLGGIATEANNADYTGSVVAKDANGKSISIS